MSAFDEFDLSEMFSALGSTALIGGVSANVIDESVRYGEDLISGGRKKEHILTLIVAKRSELAEPVAGTLVVFEDRQYVVTSYVSDSETYTLTCTDEGRRP